jgi:hypothetical protein
VNESRNYIDEYKKEQMTLILRFADKEGFEREHLFDLVHVNETFSLTLKNEIYVVIARHNLNMQNIWKKVYVSVSNMRSK